MKLLVFDISGRFAHFKRFYTTSSALSFPFPPPPTIRGMIGAILGLPKEIHKKETEDFYVGCSIINSGHKITTTLNRIRISRGKPNGRTQTRIEYIRNPKFRIYVASNNENKLNKLIDHVQSNKTYYSLYLGTAECLAKFEFVELNENAIEVEQTNIIHSIIPASLIKRAGLTREVFIRRETSVPIIMLDDRTVVLYEDVIYPVEQNYLPYFLVNQNTHGIILKYLNSNNEENYVYLWHG